MKKQVSGGIVVYNVDKDRTVKYLLLQYGAGHWDFPKGKLEQGESKDQAARRELTEETGLHDVNIHEGFEESLVYQFNDFRGYPVQKTVHFFVGEVPYKGPIVLSHEHQAYEWLPYDKALEQLTYQNAKNVLIKAQDFLHKTFGF
jgi:8-oxo-dGTP pyrophosphatase MutT (NUDIX family)